MRALIKRVVPASVRRAWRTAFGWRWFRGDYASWAEARAHAGGYAEGAILARVLAATREVAAGRSAFERDGVTFAEPSPEPALLSALRTVAEREGRLHVADFGGALGSTYWRHRGNLPAVPLRWDVVEQAPFVRAGQEFERGTALRFFDSLAAAVNAAPHDVLLCSTTLQYLEDPARTLAEWIELGWPWLLFNNLPLHAVGPDRLCVQHVPPEIYPASYPVWFFNREKFLACLASRYEIAREFASEAVWPVGWRGYPSTGLLFRRKDRA